MIGEQLELPLDGEADRLKTAQQQLYALLEAVNILQARATRLSELLTQLQRKRS